MSFDELKDVNGVQYVTFSEACLALDLIDDDVEWSRAMQGTVSSLMYGGCCQVIYVCYWLVF